MPIKNVHFLRYTFFILFSYISFFKASGNTVIMGAERTDAYFHLLKGKNVGLVVNHTSLVGPDQKHLLDFLLDKGIKVLKVFAPEHGFRGEVDAGKMVRHGKDVRTGIPIISLYGNNKKPTNEQLEDIDVMIFDIQDVGARFYTYISTMHYVMEACAEYEKKLIVFDRPNPCDYVDGPVLNRKYRSFVGLHPIPVLHGCTVGELAKMINGEGWLATGVYSCPLTVIPMKDWKHGQPYSLPVKPSPNLPNDQSVKLYASLCPFEATKISVGRGTTFPFQVLGAPDPKYGSFTFMPISLPGFDQNPMYKNQLCYGIDLREDDDIEGFSLQLVLYFYKKSELGAAFFSRPRWMALLMGTDAVRKAIIEGKSEEEIREMWQPELNDYKSIRKKYLIYKEKSRINRPSQK